MTEKTIDSNRMQTLQGPICDSLKDFKDKKLIIVGDVGLDEYVLGDVKRISPEAPVPVLEVNQEDHRLGLATNVAQNVVSLGGQALMVGVVGADATSDRLRNLLKQESVTDAHLIVDKDRPTTRKLRVMTGHHHIVRVDYEHKKFLPESVENELLNKVEALLPEAHGVILEDYAKGVLSEKTISHIIATCKSNGKVVMVDPHQSTPTRYYRGADLITPNRDEAYFMSGLNIDELREDANSYREVGLELLEKNSFGHVIMTRGSQGMSLFNSEEVVDMPTYARQVFDVTGAGDTVIAALALSWVSGASLEQSCVLANFAAGVVVGKVGCVPCSVDELKEYILSHSGSQAEV